MQVLRFLQRSVPCCSLLADKQRDEAGIVSSPAGRGSEEQDPDEPDSLQGAWCQEDSFRGSARERCFEEEEWHMEGERVELTS